jgi:hypothetical protein
MPWKSAPKLRWPIALAPASHAIARDDCAVADAMFTKALSEYPNNAAISYGLRRVQAAPWGPPYYGRSSTVPHKECIVVQGPGVTYWRS